MLRSRATKTIASVIFIGVGAYGIFVSRHVLTQPQITFDVPEVITTESPTFTIAGATDHVDHFTVNGQTLFLSEDGTFSEKRTVPVGLSEITITGTDKFNRTTEKQILIHRLVPNDFEAVARITPSETDSTPPTDAS